MATHPPMPRLRPLTRADFPLLQHWLAQPHVRRWWDHEFSDEAVEADFGACIDGLEPTDLFIGMVGDEPVGLIQRYAIASYPAYSCCRWWSCPTVRSASTISSASPRACVKGWGLR